MPLLPRQWHRLVASANARLAYAALARVELWQSHDGLARLAEVIPLVVLSTPDPVLKARLNGVALVVHGTILDLTGHDPERLATAIALARSIAGTMPTPGETADVAVNLTALLVNAALASPHDYATNEAVEAGKDAVRIARECSPEHTDAALSILSFALRLRYEARLERHLKLPRDPGQPQGGPGWTPRRGTVAPQGQWPICQL